MKNSKFLAAAALTAVLGLSLTSCGPKEEDPTDTTPAPTETAPAPTESETVKNPDFKFEGKNTIGGTEYNCVLNAFEEDHTWSLKIGSKEYTGTYVFLKGVGYRFTFNKTNEVVDTVFNNETKSHELTFVAKLGDDGSGEVTLSLKDEDFVLSERNVFLDKVAFRGISKGMMNNKMEGISFSLTFDLDGKYHMDVNRFDEFKLTGDYKFENNQFVLTMGDKTVKSNFDIQTGLYTIDLALKSTDGQDINTTLKFDSRNNLGKHGLSGLTKIMGMNFGVTLYIDGRGNCLFDAYSSNPLTTSLGGMDLDAAYDKVGTYTIDAEGNYVFKTVDVKYDIDETTHQPKLDENGKPIELSREEHTWNSVFDETTGEYTVHYELAGTEGNFVYDLVGTDFGRMPILAAETAIGGGQIKLKYELLLGKADQAIVKCTASMGGNGHWNADGTYTPGNFDRVGTYTFVNNELKVTFGEDVFTATYDEATGTYKMPYTQHGKDADINVDLTFNVFR